VNWACQTGLTELFSPALVTLLLQRQRFVEHQEAQAGKVAHLLLLLAIGHQFV